MKNVTLSLLAAAAIDAISIGSVSAMPVNDLAGLRQEPLSGCPPGLRPFWAMLQHAARLSSLLCAYGYSLSRVHVTRVRRVSACDSSAQVSGSLRRFVAIARYMTENSRNPTKTEIGQVRRACRALVAAGYFESIATVDGEAF